MEKRVFLAIFLSFAVLALYQAYFAPATPTPPQARVETPGPSAAPAPAAPAANPPSSVIPTPSAPVVNDAAAKDIRVETDTVSAVFTTRGAALKSWRLKKYSDGQGQPLELVPQDVPEKYERPFTVAVDDAAVSAVLRSAIYQPSTEGLQIGAGSGTVIFSYRDASGLTAYKTFEFQPAGKAYVINVDASVIAAGKSQPVTVQWGPGLGLGYASDNSRPFPVRGVKLVLGSHVLESADRLAASNLEKQSWYEEPLRFAGVEDQYFLTAALPSLSSRQAQTVRVDYRPITVEGPADSQNRMRALVAYSVRTPGPASVSFYMGPKDFDALKSVDPELTYAIDFGMFRPLVVPLLQALKWINGYLGNFGWSIVALTVFINALIFPLRHRSMVSMRKMQAVQPEVKLIQDRYAKYKITDPERQKMNQEMMALYKQRGVNPASGCVPMLLTMPVLFAFYSMLGASIELRGAPFFGWLHDLSTKDPYYITPILMGGTMFWQQRMMPSTADPVQQKMFLLMPVVFTFMFLQAPSGLVVYWFVSNLLAIGQQYTTNRLIGAPVRVARPIAAGAPQKQVGSGRTKG